MEIVVYLKSDYSLNESLILDRVHSKEEIREILNNKYGHNGWYSYDIMT